MDNEYREKILRDCSKEYILNMAEAFRHGLKMWREAYKAEVGDVRYQELLQKISGEEGSITR